MADINTVRNSNGFRELTAVLSCIYPLVLFGNAIVDVRGPNSRFSASIWSYWADITWSAQEWADLLGTILFFVSALVTHDLYRGRMIVARATTFWMIGILSVALMLIGVVQGAVALIYLCPYYGPALCSCDPTAYLTDTALTGSGWCLSTMWAGYVRVEFVALFTLRCLLILLAAIWLEYFWEEVSRTNVYANFYVNGATIISTTTTTVSSSTALPSAGGGAFYDGSGGVQGKADFSDMIAGDGSAAAAGGRPMVVRIGESRRRKRGNTGPDDNDEE